MTIPNLETGLGFVSSADDNENGPAESNDPTPTPPAGILIVEATGPSVRPSRRRRRDRLSPKRVLRWLVASVALLLALAIGVADAVTPSAEAQPAGDDPDATLELSVVPRDLTTTTVVVPSIAEAKQAAENRLLQKDTVQAVQPPPVPAPYTVVAGDSLSKIANQFGLDLPRWIEQLQLPPPHVIHPGLVLDIAKAPKKADAVPAGAQVPPGTAEVKLTADTKQAPAKPAEPAKSASTGRFACGSMKGKQITVASTSPQIDAVIKEACKQLGKPYVWGANGPSSFDCSGLVRWAYNKGAGKGNLPRTSAGMAASDLSGQAIRPDTSLMRPGDLVFYYSPVTHVALYIGDGLIVTAPQSGEVVKISQVEFPSMQMTHVRRPLAV